MLSITTIRKAIAKFRRPKSIVILAYHRICELTGLFYDRNVSATPSEFRRQMEHVKKNYTAIPIRRLVDYYDGKTDIPKNSIVITFDDGFKDTVENALPILRELELPAIVFIATDFLRKNYTPWEDEMAYLINQIAGNNRLDDVNAALRLNAGAVDKESFIFMICKSLRGVNGRQRSFVLKQLYTIAGLSEANVRQILTASPKGMMDDEDVMEWVASGLEIGSHTCSHPQLSNINSAEAEKELLFSKCNLEKISNKEVIAFAYPYGMKGYYNKDSIKSVQKAGYRCAVSLIGGINGSKTNRFDLKRVGIAPYVSFESACAGLIQYQKKTTLYSRIL